MSTKVQLTGGAFQDSEGNVLANGYLEFKLSQDAATTSSQICSGVAIKITLDSSGNVAGTQYIWGNDQLQPNNTYYRVTGYTAAGQIAWGPNNQQVIGNGGTFSLGSWVPNTVISWNPPPQPLTLQTNEVQNGSQTLLDLHAGTGITLADNGSGRVTINGAVVSTSGLNVVSRLPFNLYYRGSGSTLATSGFTWAQLISANAISLVATSTKVGIYIATPMSGPLGELVIIRTLRDDLNTVDVTPVLFGGNAHPTLGSGMHISDAISMPVDNNHDYYFGFTGNTFGGSGNLAATNAQSSSGLDYTGVAGNTNNGGNPLSVSWATAVPVYGTAFPIGAASFFIASWTVA